MKKFILAIIFLLVSIPSHAAGPYDGIYTLNLNGNFINYMSIHENEIDNNINITAISLYQDNGLEWEAFSGLRTGNRATLITLIGSGEIELDVVFNGDNTGVITIISCIEDCNDFPNGTVFNIDKII